MYMFFWFFKQLYYVTRKIFKHGLLLLLLFFIAFLFIFVKPSFCAYVIYDPVLEEDVSLPDLPFDTSTYSTYFLGYTNHRLDYASTAYFICYPSSNFDKFFHDTSGTENRINYYIPNTSTSGGWVYYYITNQGAWRRETTANPLKYGTGYLVQATNNIYTNNTYTDIYFEKNIAGDPYIMNESNTIVNWSFDYLDIFIPGDYTGIDSYTIRYTYPNTNTSYTDSVNTYYTTVNNQNILHIPRSFFQDDIVIRSGNTFTFQLTIRTSSLQTYTYSLGSYTLSLTQQEQQETNEDSNKQLLSDINTNQQQTNEKLDELNDTITDTNLADDSVFFPTLDVPDLVQDGLTHIFDAFVLAFCSDTPQDIVVPFPFTNKTFTIPANYTRSMLNTYSPFLLALIEVIWWYHISKIVILDLADKGDKLRSGNIESMQTFNITTKIL